MKINTSKANRLAPSQASELLNIAAKAGRLATEVSREPEEYQMAGRLNRLIQFQFSELNEREVTAFAEAHVQMAKEGKDLFVGHPHEFYLLHSALAQVSYSVWEDLWNEKHPARFGQAWEGEDFDLMGVWRERVRIMIQECRQSEVFCMSTEEYVAKLIAGGASEEPAEQLAEWLLEIMYEGTTGSC